MIKIVRGDVVRKTLDPSFVAGGHGLIYPWYIPKNEIWLDGRLDPKEIKYIFAHEEFEYRLMQKGMNYNGAHDKACVIEKDLRAKTGVAYYPRQNPIESLRLIKIGSGENRILITSGIHGDERSGPYALIKFLLEKQNLKNLNADIIPLINPSGFEKKTRKDKNGKDLNRWFFDKPKKNEPQQCKILKNFFKKVKKPYDLLISLHEDPDREEFYLYDTGNGKNSKIIQTIFKKVKNAGVKLWTGFDDLKLKNYIEDSYFKVQSPDSSPTLEEYLHRNNKVKKVLTLEIPGKLPLNKKIDFTQSILKDIVKNLNPAQR